MIIYSLWYIHNTYAYLQLSSVTQSYTTLWDPMDIMLPCPPPSPGACSNSCPSSRWCHPTISSSVIFFSSCHLSFPASGSFPMSQFFASGRKNYWSFSFSISPFNEYSGLISFSIDQFDLLAVQGTLNSIFQHCSSKASIPRCSVSLWSSFHIHTWLLEKP